MAEENKSQLISEAELIEAINADSIISVSLGAGQPQKNVKLSTLASVVAGIIGLDNTKLLQYNGGIDNANTNKQGLYIVSSNTANIPTGTSLFQYGGMLVTLRFGLDHYMLQLLAPRLGGNHLYFRLKIDTWLDWRKFLFE